MTTTFSILNKNIKVLFGSFWESFFPLWEEEHKTIRDISARLCSKGKGPMMGICGEALGPLRSMPTGYSSFGLATIRAPSEHSSCQLFCFVTLLCVNAFLMLWTAGKPKTPRCRQIKDFPRSDLMWFRQTFNFFCTIWASCRIRAGLRFCPENFHFLNW